MALIEEKTETAAERNARLQAAFSRSSTSAPAVPKTSTTASSFYSRGGIPQTTTTPKQDVRLEGPLSWTVPKIPTIPSQTTSGASDFYSQGGLPPAVPTQTSSPSDFYSQGGLPQATRPGQTNQQLITDAARWTGQAIFDYGVLPNNISSVVANELPYTYYGYSSADQFLEDLGYFEENPGQWTQGDTGTTTTSSGSGTSSYLRGTSGSGYAGRYAGATTGLINWRMGF